LVFVDESFVHQNHVSNSGLTIQNALLQKPTGKSKRIVIARGLTESGCLGHDYNQTEFAINDDRS